MELIRKGRRLESPFSGQRYEIYEKLGGGGFGEAFRACLITRSGTRQNEVCIKVTQDQDSWHKESYFGNLLKHVPRVIQLYESFPLESRVGGIKTTLYYLISELATKGTILDYLQMTNNKRWSPSRAKREVMALLQVLNSLHGGGVTHRDLTPMNIFVTDGPTLKLGDFGIATQALAGMKAQDLAFNPYFVTGGFDGSPPDDVFQIGQLLGALLTGTAGSMLKVRDVKSKLLCDEELKSVVLRAIGPKKHRYVDAYELMQALQGEAESRTKLRSLKGKTVVFTGPMKITRENATILVFQAGGTVVSEVNNRTSVLVVGGRSPHYSGHGVKGNKLKMALKINRRNPDKIALIGEPDFRRLVRT